METPLLTVKDVAQKLNVSEQLVYDLCSARSLRHIRPGRGRGTIRIPDDAVLDYVRHKTVPTRESPSPELRHINLAEP